MTATLSRAQLFSRGARGGTALFLSGSAVALLAGPAAADTIPDGDLAYARLLIGAELLAADFYTRAIASKRFGGDALKYLKRALFNEGEHYEALSGVLTGAGQPPAVAEDFDFAYPKNSFGSRGAVAKLGVALETAFLGAYLGAVDGLQTSSLEQVAARIAASEAQHLSLLTQQAGRDPVGVSFPGALTIEEASDALDAYTS